ncbi:hypothetical protein EDM56_05340 [Brevibacillus fluminis]|uniref:Uncharacterized protein n=1 Tax=Brevibacillus fluminis TaxID=511487 RepID=A0A3M8DVT1_9BACL|nr:hypothetical protein [Brevibacillus fluminis]RNB91461.1 hypothetical protein EDM56_05340 [Brevibacillus fluminis]
MKTKTMAASLAVFLGVVGTAYAAGVSPYGQTGNFENVLLTVDNKPTQETGVLINGQLYVPAKALSDQRKLAYYYDKDSYNAYLFFGGGDNDKNVSANVAMYTNNHKSRQQIESEIMKGIPYETNDYHSGMMMQDINNIAGMIKGLLSTSDMIEYTIQMKLSQNVQPNMDTLRQQILYRSIPFDIMEDRMNALANELGRQLGSKERRRMEDIIDDIQTAVKRKEKALNALDDWLDSSSKRDLEDVRDYEADVKKYMYQALLDLTGEDLKNPGKVKSDGLKQKVDKWIRDKSSK